MAVISVRCLGRAPNPPPLEEALASYLGRTPDQIRRTLAHAAPALLDAVCPSGRSSPASAKSSPKAHSASGSYEGLFRILVKATSGTQALFLLVDDLHAADPDTSTS